MTKIIDQQGDIEGLAVVWVEKKDGVFMAAWSDQENTQVMAMGQMLSDRALRELKSNIDDG